MRKAQPYRPPERSIPPRTSPIDVREDVDLDAGPQLAAGHDSDLPLWQRDTISLSKRAQRLIERIRPAIVRVLSYWDHRVTRLSIDDRTLSVDSSGSYRVD